MLRRKKDATKRDPKKTKVRKEKKSPERRAGRAQGAIRETRQTPARSKTRKADAGPPLRIEKRKGSKPQSMTPTDVVGNTKGGRKR